jgi:uncharacterized protein YceH (UPF0502 family)
MDIELTAPETRVIACLIEKAITTPDQYPLSLNALTNACNQKSNRDPVMQLDEAAVQRTLDALAKRHLVGEKSGYGSRVPKYQHYFCNTTFGSLRFSPQELGVLCELMLRGPQTPGELRTRASRLCALGDVTEVESVLKDLMEREAGPVVAQLAREPGRRESRFAHLLGGPVATASRTPEAFEPRLEPDQDRIARLEARVGLLEGTVEELRRRLAPDA